MATATNYSTFGQSGKEVKDKVQETVGQSGKEVKNKLQEVGTAVADKANETATAVVDKAKEVASSVAHTAENVACAVGHKAEDAAAAVGSGMQSLAGAIRAKSPKEGTIADAGSAVANTLESGGRYLKEEGLGGIADEVIHLIRRNPFPAVLLGIAVGYLFARATTTRS
jgi:hypothetical protein